MSVERGVGVGRWARERMGVLKMGKRAGGVCGLGGERPAVGLGRVGACGIEV